MTLPMHARVVSELAAAAEIGLDGIEIQLEDGEEWRGRDVYGYCDPYGEVIILFPAAFETEEQLVRTLAHERMHAFQARMLGPPRDSVDGAAREIAALECEEVWWQFYRDKH